MTNLVRLGNKGAAAIEFALIAPALIMLMFAILVYSTYFATYIGVRQAAAEGARAALAGLSTSERTTLATARAQQVLDQYGLMLSAGSQPDIRAGVGASGSFEVKISYDISGSPIMRYGALLPLPNTTITSSVIVGNGSYS
ncbi:pilus assembly protein TadE [Rhizorhabdus wittichii DC-6]|nr:pilus assembly protein TadE [Rhizorhabdus wittichii DC-6]